MRILHAPENIGGMAGVLAKVQSQLGHEAFSYSFTANQFMFYSDFTLKNPSSRFEKLTNAIRFLFDFDIFHFYFGSSLLGSNLSDVNILDKLGKKVFFYFCGCDIRDEKITIMNYPISACKNCFPKLCNDNRDRAKAIANTYGRVNFVSTPDLLEFVERAELLPQIVDFQLINEISVEQIAKDDKKFIVAHAPTNRLIKGTQYIIDSIEKLRRKGLDIELMLIENETHANALRKYRHAHIAVDQLLVGSYGLLAAELMALGVPTITYLREDLIDKYPERPPLINANPQNIEDVIVELYENRNLLEEYSFKSRDYAYNIHHPVRNAIKCLECYER